MRILILNLLAFDQMGGVEKVSRILAKAAADIALETGKTVFNYSLYDTQSDPRYCLTEQYKAFRKNKFRFVLEAIKQGIKSNHLILTHVNLALPALLIKLFNPQIKIHLIAHGIEIWNPLSRLQQNLLAKCAQILAVSNYTKKRIAEQYPSTAGRITVLNNCLDPFYSPASAFTKPAYLRERYRIKDNEKVIITLCRLSSSEKYKGYDNVLESLNSLKQDFNFKYLLLGKYDEMEFIRISDIIKKESLEERVIIAGFVKDEELTDHFLLGDLFIMPSVKEGFGIVFIEAAASGMPVIAGNKDGSVDALLNGELGPLIEPFDKQEITNAIRNMLLNPPSPERQQSLAIQHFSYEVYKENLKKHLGFN